MRAPEIKGPFEVCIYDRDTKKKILSTVYDDLNLALKATRTWTTSLTLRSKWYRVEIIDGRDTTRELEEFNLVGV